MRDTTIARNYAEALVELARRSGPDALDRWGTLLDELAAVVRDDQRFRLFLESPRVSASQKNEILGKALDGAGSIPRTFVLFVQALVTHRRQMLVPEIADEYHDIVDAVEGRVHATVTVARPADAAEQALIVERLSKSFGKEVIPHYQVNPAILGGVVVRVGDTVLDGSVRRRLGTLKAVMLAGR
jgi:F-type H+-transporting ATPase subunit delta